MVDCSERPAAGWRKIPVKTFLLSFDPLRQRPYQRRQFVMFGPLPGDVQKEMVRVELRLVTFRPPLLHEIQTLRIGPHGVDVDHSHGAVGRPIFRLPAALDAATMNERRKLGSVGRMER